MDWKEKLEDKVNRIALNRRINNYDNFIEYISDYLENYFNFKEGNDLCKFEKENDLIELNILDYTFTVDCSAKSNIVFHRYDKSSHYILGYLRFGKPELTFTKYGDSESKPFKEEFLEEMLKTTFRELWVSKIQVLK